MPKAKRKRQSGFNPFEGFFDHRFTPPDLPPAPGVSKLETELLTEMLREGYKRCAMKYHPDHEGGDAEKMRELNRLKRELNL